MTSRDFCYWLHGYLELASVEKNIFHCLTEAQTEVVQKHLAMVFKHEIDPSMPSPDLNKIHGGVGAAPHNPFTDGNLVRC